jgi:hypothetical protein
LFRRSNGLPRRMMHRRGHTSARPPRLSATAEPRQPLGTGAPQSRRARPRTTITTRPRRLGDGLANPGLQERDASSPVLARMPWRSSLIGRHGHRDSRAGVTVVVVVVCSLLEVERGMDRCAAGVQIHRQADAVAPCEAR